MGREEVLAYHVECPRTLSSCALLPDVSFLANSTRHANEAAALLRLPFSSPLLISSAVYLAPVAPLLVALPQPSGQHGRQLPGPLPRLSWASRMLTMNAVLNRRKQEHASKTFSGVKWSHLASPSLNAEHIFRPGFFLLAPRPRP